MRQELTRGEDPDTNPLELLVQATEHSAVFGGVGGAHDEEDAQTLVGGEVTAEDDTPKEDEEEDADPMSHLWDDGVDWGGEEYEHDDGVDESCGVESFSSGSGSEEGERKYARAASSVRNRDSSGREVMVICEFERERESEVKRGIDEKFESLIREEMDDVSEEGSVGEDGGKSELDLSDWEGPTCV